MRPLATEFRKDGYDFHLLERVADVALFEKRAGAIVSWEVVVVQKYGERTIMGRVVPPTEAMPSTESWGQKGWTLTTLAAARLRLVDIVVREQEKGERL